jgi:hypothetical protein
LPASSRGQPGWRWAIGAEAGLTEGGGPLRGGGDGSVRRGPHQREGRRQLWLAPGAVRKDEGGEGGSKSENGSGLIGLIVGDDGGQKRIGDHSGSVAGMDEMHACLAVGGGERESLATWSGQRVTGCGEKFGRRWE